MKLSEKKFFVQLLTNVSELYGKSLSAGVFEVYWNALKLYPFPTIQEALTRHVLNTENGQFMPKPADILRQIENANQPKAQQAWEMVVECIRTHGSYSIPDLAPHIMQIIREMGGWQSLCRSREDQMPHIVEDFQRRYQSYQVLQLTYQQPEKSDENS